MRSTLFIPFFLLFIFNINAAPSSNPCRGKQNIISNNIRTCYIRLRDGYSYMATAVLTDGIDRQKALRKATDLIYAADQTLMPTLNAPEDSAPGQLLIKVEKAKKLLNEGLPYWPFLAKLLKVTRTTWSKVKDKIKGVFKKPEVIKIDAETRERAVELARTLNAEYQDANYWIGLIEQSC